MEDVARRDVEPTDVAVRPPARHDADAGAVLVAPPVRHPACHRQAEVEDHGQVHEHDVPLGDGEVMDHGRSRHLDDLALHEPSVGIGAVIHEVGRQIRVAEEMELSRSRAELRMRGHRRGEASTEVEAADRLQLARHLGGERRLDQGQDPTGMGDDVRVRPPDRVVAGAIGPDRRRILDERARPDPAVPVPDGPAVAKLHAVEHAVPHEPVGGVAGFRVRAIAHVASAQLAGERAVDGKIEGGHLVLDRRVVAGQMEGQGLLVEQRLVGGRHRYDPPPVGVIMPIPWRARVGARPFPPSAILKHAHGALDVLQPLLAEVLGGERLVDLGGTARGHTRVYPGTACPRGRNAEVLAGRLMKLMQRDLGPPPAQTR